MRRPIGFGPLGGHGFIHDPSNINAGPTTAHLSEALRMKAEMMAAANRAVLPHKPAEPKQTKKGSADDR